MNPDVVYIYSHEASWWRGRELLFSLRSLEKYGTGYNKVWLIGDKPAYLNDKINHIEMDDDSTHPKERKLFEKLLRACNTNEITKDFVFFNDDFFLTKEIDFSNLPECYSSKNIKDIIRGRKKNAYTYAITNTYNVLIEKKAETKYFDIHYPMIYNKAKFQRTVGKCDWETAKAGYVIKSLYANLNKIPGRRRKDNKIYNEKNIKTILAIVESTDLFSTDEITHAMVKVLNRLYSDKSSYEQ